MAILKIARMGHPVLLTEAMPVADPGAPEIRRLVADMAETMEDASGIGLAAPQVHVPLRIFVWRIPGGPQGGAQGGASAAGEPGVLINPVLTPIGEEREDGWEGCLSIPGLRGCVGRWKRLRYEGVDTEGRPVTGEAEGLLARMMQHETDHLDGILYTMRMEDLSLLGFTEELARVAAAAAARQENTA